MMIDNHVLQNIVINVALRCQKESNILSYDPNKRPNHQKLREVFLKRIDEQLGQFYKANKSKANLTNIYDIIDQTRSNVFLYLHTMKITNIQKIGGFFH